MNFYDYYYYNKYIFTNRECCLELKQDYFKCLLISNSLILTILWCRKYPLRPSQMVKKTIIYGCLCGSV